MALSNLSEHVLNGYARAIQRHPYSGRAMQAEFVLFPAYRESHCASFHKERRELITIDLCEHDEKVCKCTVCNPHLGAVQHISSTIRVPGCDSSSAQCIRT